MRDRPNLTIETHCLVLKILFEKKKAIGVEYVQRGVTRRVYAVETILAAGAFNSPQLLMLSGVGPSRELPAVGIEPIHDLPAVGRNLQDHPLVAAVYATSRPLGFESLLRLDRLGAALLRWWLRGTGPLGEAPLSVQAYLRLDPQSPEPDMQFQVSHVSMLARPWFPGWRGGAGHQFTAAAMQMRPTGRGSVTLRSSDPRDPPRIRLGLLNTESDRRFARSMLQFVRTFFATAPVTDLIAKELMPGAAVATEAAIDTHLRQTIQTAMHPTSTCAMGLDPADSVVNDELRVHGMTGLRVVDASVMPTIVSGNTNAPAIMIAEKASDLILHRSPPGCANEVDTVALAS